VTNWMMGKKDSRLMFGGKILIPSTMTTETPVELLASANHFRMGPEKLKPPARVAVI